MSEPTPPPAPSAPPAPPEPSAPQLSGRDRLRALLGSRPSGPQLLVGILLALLGFALALQVRSTRTDPTLEGARQSDLVRILDDVSERAERLQAESRSLEALLADLTSGTDRSRAALEDAQERTATLGILAGTVPAEGPGIQLTITGPRDAVTSSMLLDTVQELRDAGAEAMQIADDETSVRVVAETHLSDDADGIAVDGQRLSVPYRVLAIGDPRTLSAALDIPGGVLDTLGRVDADGTVSQLDSVVIDAIRVRTEPEFARAASD
jgi:uncharacterized protein YlxW (UPF0749 family)